MTAGPPTEPPILTAEFSHIQTALGIALDLSNDPEYVELAIKSLGTIRARLRDAEETLDSVQGFVFSDLPDAVIFYRIATALSAYFERHADPQEKPSNA